MSALRDAPLPPGSRIVLEKPFGEDLGDAVGLNRLLSGFMAEEAVFRVDHFLAMATVQNILGSRLANRVMEPIWNSTHIAEVDILWEESLAHEGRAGYYDGVGAQKDKIQNQQLHLQCLIAMEPPVSLGERDLRDRKVDVLRSVRPLTETEVRTRTRRARYAAGRIGDRAVPAYVDEEGVDPAHRTETFAEIELELDNWRWPGTTFRLRAAKALGRDRKEVAVRFREVPHLPIPATVEPNVIRFGLDPESQGPGAVAGVSGRLARPRLTAQLPCDCYPTLSVHERLTVGYRSREARGLSPSRRTILRRRDRGAGGSTCP